MTPGIQHTAHSAILKAQSTRLMAHNAIRDYTMKLLYDIAFITFSIVYLPYLVIKGKAHKDFRQRFGVLPDSLKPDLKRTIWVHAVSVGEVMAARPFCEHLERALPNFRLVISTTTKTGQDAAKRSFKGRINTFYLPLDISFIVERTIRFINPFMFILFETEIWPNLITGLSKRDVPVFLINGRISDRSLKGYLLIRHILKDVLNRITVFCMQTPRDAERIISIGAPEHKVKVTGNVKYDVEMPDDFTKEMENGQKRKLGIGPEEQVIICGSTHRGEEEVLLESYSRLMPKFKGLRIIIAPRHIDRVDEVAGICREKRLNYIKISAMADTQMDSGKRPVLILDTMGRLSRLYTVATIVFIGGSLVKKGGHNIIEAARYGKPTIFGVHTSNFRDMSEIFIRANASMRVSNNDELISTFMLLLGDDLKRMSMGLAAVRLVEDNRGAVSKAADIIKSYLDERLLEDKEFMKVR